MKNLIAALLVLLLLTGCTGMRLVGSDVQAVSTVAAGMAPPAGSLTGGRYRFERLPLHATHPQSERIEAIAQAALTKVGLMRDDASAQFSALLGARIESYVADLWGQSVGPWVHGGWPVHGHTMGGHGGILPGFGLRLPPPTFYRYEVGLVLRDLRSSQVVFETRAMHEGPWSDADNILPALFEAALKDFPNAPTGVRRINIEIPR